MNAVNPTVVMTSLARQAGWDKPDIAKPYLDRIPLGHFAGIYICALSLDNGKNC